MGLAGSGSMLTVHGPSVSVVFGESAVLVNQLILE